jgi:hypothetical protein
MGDRAHLRRQGDMRELEERGPRAGQSFYVFDFFSLARGVLALGGNAMRRLFLQKVGDHLDTWTTQPSHRRAWKQLLESL